MTAVSVSAASASWMPDLAKYQTGASLDPRFMDMDLSAIDRELAMAMSDPQQRPALEAPEKPATASKADSFATRMPKLPILSLKSRKSKS